MSNSTNTAGDGSDFILQARTIAPLANREDDLLPSALLSFFDFVLTGITIFRWLKPPWSGRKSDVQILSAIGMLSLAVGFMVRAIVSNTAAVSQSGVITQEIFFFLGHLMLADAALTLTRDLLVETTQSAHSHVYFTIFARIVLLVSFALQIAGDSNISNPPTRELPTGSPTQLRLWGSLISFAVISLNLFLYNIAVIPFIRPRWVPLSAVFWLNATVWFTSFYVFMIAAVTTDDWALVRGTVWFYITFGFLSSITGVLLLALNFERMFGPPRPWYFMG